MDSSKNVSQETFKLPLGSPWPIPAFNVMMKPGGPACNMACEYCFYRHNSDKLYSSESATIAPALLDRFIREYIQSQQNPTVFFTWQGGEPTLMGLEFFRKVVAIQKRHARPEVRIANALQTNGLLLDDTWCAFLKENRFVVGLSIDGPADMHDAFRKTAGGLPTHARVRAAMDCLVKHGVPVNSLTTISPVNVERAEELYTFLTAELGSSYLQFQPCVERKDFHEVAPGHWDPSACPVVGSPQASPGHKDSVLTDWSISSGQWGKFLCDFFDLWWSRDRETVRVNWFDSWASQWVGRAAHMCICSPVCGRALSMERDGRVYSCDHYVYPEYCLGNLNERSLDEMARSDRQRRFGEAKQTTLPAFCKRCPFLFACYGECPKRRFLRTPDGQPGLNYFCGAYRTFFDHAASRLAEYGKRFRPPAGGNPQQTARGK
jgi:uncharacterized protein